MMFIVFDPLLRVQANAAGYPVAEQYNCSVAPCVTDRVYELVPLETNVSELVCEITEIALIRPADKQHNYKIQSLLN
jgi:hypothetical protein